ncbi:very short patch repair endonuclease [Candidatus Woesearchaeota archaeon]|nr:very short patch repair endonuclease [Candidatus Woesearchaeota archaeon]MBW3006002.1 very short patch repair endonuclease [Candidatus Woesearchaeota archaeon]
MTDVLTKEQRSYCMSKIRGKHTKPELKLRRELTKRGLRGYRIHYKLIGSPDMVYPKYRLAIFIDGCFWHKCPKCFIEPATRKQFWLQKIKGNVQRDIKVRKALRKKGWKVIRFYEHEIKKDLNRCFKKILNELAKRGFKHAQTIKNT